MLLNEISSVSKHHPKAWGYSLHLDCEQCDREIITDKQKIIEFFGGLIKQIKMIPHDEPMIEHFPNRDPAKNGYSYIQLIETSSITGHFVDKTLAGYIDIFTCKDFSEEDAIAYVKEKLKPTAIKVTFLTRNA